MDKNTFESFEYLPSSSAGNADQFFVVQDGETFIVNRHVQYVADMQNSKQNLDTGQACGVYNVTPPQYFVDVNNSSQLISVPDQFILPDEGNNAFSTNYLTKTESNEQLLTTNMPIEQYKTDASQSNLNVESGSNRQVDCTEITVSEEQYHMLEQKGWSLVELGDKVCLVDTLGIHDITSNIKLIHKLKTETHDYFNQTIRTLKSESDINNIENNTQMLPNNFSNFEIKTDTLDKNEMPEERNHFDVKVKEVKGDESEEAMDVIDASSPTEDNTDETIQTDESHNATTVLIIDNKDIHREGSHLKIKTKLSLINFPNKIVLGRTKNGKQLVARIVKNKSTMREKVIIDEHESDMPEKLTVVKDRKRTDEKNIPTINYGNLLNESEFLTLIEHFLQNDIPKCTDDDLKSANSVITHLLKVPAFKTSVVGANLVVTKTVQFEDHSGYTTAKALLSIVTGKVYSDKEELHFEHLPYLLQNLNDKVSERDPLEDPIDMNPIVFDILHIQIAETKQITTNTVKVTVTVMKRVIPINMISNIQKLHANTTYACSACAALFENEKLLNHHQENGCPESDKTSMLIPQPTAYRVITEGKTKSYACTQCEAKFTKLFNCKNHLKSHFQADKSNSMDKLPNGVYKCNMCLCTYFHPSTLSKHILARHIKIKK